MTHEGVETSVVADILFKINWKGKYEMWVKNGATYNLLEGACDTVDYKNENKGGLIVHYFSDKYGIIIEPKEDFNTTSNDPTYERLQLIADAVRRQAQPEKAKSSEREFSTFYLGHEESMEAPALTA